MLPDNRLYQPIDTRQVDIPPASRLYHLEPCGVGTPEVESLTSYISRLAEAHCVFPGILMERTIAPVVEKKYSSANLHKIYSFTGAANGKGTMARDLVTALETLTCNQNLECLTLLNLSELLPSRHLIRRNRAWCPQCYKDWQSSNSIVIDCLLWTLRPVKVCPWHWHPIVDECPHCHCRNLPLAWATRAGYCVKCGNWLGVDSHFSNSTDTQWEWHLWVARNLGDLLAFSPNLKLVSYKDKVAKSLNMYAKEVTQGNLAALARHLQVPKNTFWLWCRGKNQPSLEALLRICYCLKVSVIDFLEREPGVMDTEAILLRPSPSSSKPRAKSKPFDALGIRCYLETVLESGEIPPPSMEEVAKRLQWDRRTIYQHFSELCHQISAKYTKYRRDIYWQTVKECCEEVRQVAMEIYNRGEYPTEALVCKQVSKPGYLRYKLVRQALKEVQQELKIGATLPPYPKL